jgi:hypothetical protein
MVSVITAPFLAKQKASDLSTGGFFCFWGSGPDSYRENLCPPLGELASRNN